MESHRRWLPAAILVLALTALVGASPPRSVYDFTLNRIDGSPQSLSAYRGKVILLVNVASKCAFTPQYDGLEALYKRYAKRGFVVLGFPSNDFAGQEPGSNAEIAEFCRATWSVRFPMFEKITVKGRGQHPLYAWLTSRPEPIGGEIEWNFQKFLVDRRGNIVERLAPLVEPEAPALVGTIESLLAEPVPEGVSPPTG